MDNGKEQKENMMALYFRKCTIADLSVLADFSRSVYYDAFSALNTPENMNDYLEKAFASDKLLAELSDSNSAFYFLYSDDMLIGYLKLNEAPSQTDLNDSESVEIERIYILKDFQHRGFGQLLIDKAINEAREKGKKYVWLGVWEKNTNAIAFYKKNGFEIIGIHPFVMGDDKQTDFIMRRDL